LFCAYFDVTEASNASTGSVHGFEHKNILHVDHSLEEVAARAGVTEERLHAKRNGACRLHGWVGRHNGLIAQELK
jgi:uncharacterized protein YyaL (SSP411 family)